MTFEEYYYIEEGLKDKVKTLGLASLLALSSKADIPMISFGNDVGKPIASSNSVLFNDKLFNYIKKSEGARSKLYKDSKGLWTIGIGHLVKPEELSKFKGKTLSEAEIQKIFNNDIVSKIALAKQKIGNKFDSLSDDMKIAIIDGFFRGDLSGSPRSLQYIRSGKYKEAAKEYLNNAEYKSAKSSGSGVASRMERNAKVISSEQT